MNPGTYAKAFIGALVAGLSALGTALTDGQITASEWAIVVGAVLGGLVLVWGYPNAPVQPPVPDSVTTVNVDRAPVAGASERLVQPSNGIQAP